MDVQRTMDFILEQQAATSATLVEIAARQGEMAAWQREMTAWQREIAAWQAKTDRRLNAISKLLQTGMKMLVKTDEKLNELAAAHKELAAAQKQTELNLNRLIGSQRRGSNGHKR